MQRFISAKEQIGITGSVLDETVALQALSQRKNLLPQIKEEINAGLLVTRKWVENEPVVEWVEPDGGVTCCLRLPSASDQEMLLFYEILKSRYKTAIGPGYWFKLPLNQMRIGFGYCRPEITALGLECVSQAINEALN
jgi:DNA-binding transcriptional MocR family regulator